MPRSTFYSVSSRLPQSTDYSYLGHKWIYINVNKYNDKLAMLLFLLICQWRVCKIVCNFQHYFGGRSKRESSCLEIRSSARFLREIWTSYFARRILEAKGVFVGGIVNIRNECLFLAHLSRRLEWAIVIAHHPSSVRPSVRPSVRRPSVVRKLSHFRLLLQNRLMDFDET